MGTPTPKILLAKPGLVLGGTSPGTGTGLTKDDEANSASSISLNLLSDSLEFQLDRFLPFLTDNTDFTVVGVIGPPGVGKSTLLNLIYGFQPNSPGMVPPFAVQTEDIWANSRHCSTGIEPRISSQRFILLDTQPVFSASLLTEITRPDGSSTLPLSTPDIISSELAHHQLGIQLGVLLASVCHILLVVSDGADHPDMWHLMSTVDLLKHGIPDPSSVTAHSHSSNLGPDKDNKDRLQQVGEEYSATPIFVHTNLRDEDLSPQNSCQMEKALNQYFSSSSFTKPRSKSSTDHLSVSKYLHATGSDSKMLDLFLVPRRIDHSLQCLYESYDSAVWKLRDHVLSMTRPSFSRSVSEREWLKNTAKIWEMVKYSSLIAEYCRMLQSSGLFKKESFFTAGRARMIGD